MPMLLAKEDWHDMYKAADIEEKLQIFTGVLQVPYKFYKATTYKNH